MRMLVIEYCEWGVCLVVALMARGLFIDFLFRAAKRIFLLPEKS